MCQRMCVAVCVCVCGGGRYGRRGRGMPPAPAAAVALCGRRWHMRRQRVGATWEGQQRHANEAHRRTLARRGIPKWQWQMNVHGYGTYGSGAVYKAGMVSHAANMSQEVCFMDAEYGRVGRVGWGRGPGHGVLQACTGGGVARHKCCCCCR